jgi:predicted phage tail protein
MMKTIRLFGDLLNDFEPEWQLAVKTPSEALRAIEANRPGFLSACDAGKYAVILFDPETPELTRQVIMENSNAPWHHEELHIMPTTGGNIPAAALVPLFYAIGFTYAAAAIAAPIAAAIISLAISLAVSALANLITGSSNNKQVQNNATVAASKPSFISNGAVNVVNGGNPYPIIAGNFRCGSIVLSSQIHVTDI